MTENNTLHVGDHARINGMPGRSGAIDRLSTAPGELIARIEDHWYLASAVKTGAHAD